MKNTRFAIFGILLAFGILFSACDDGSTDPGPGKLFFKNKNNSSNKNIRSVTITGNKVEFYVTRFILKNASQYHGGAWIIGDGIITDENKNRAWYDTDGLNQAEVYNHLGGQPHSCIILSINAIKLNDEIILEKDLTPGHGIDIVAGDSTKMGAEAVGAPKIIPFDGVTGIDNITEFIIYVDETKLLKVEGGELVLVDDWWNCFSFFVR
jgi:hypothetical protein